MANVVHTRFQIREWNIITYQTKFGHWLCIRYLLFQENNFSTFPELVKFIWIRSNVFEISHDLVRNHSQEFREMFGYLVNVLCSMDQSKRTVEVVNRAVVEFGAVS